MKINNEGEELNFKFFLSQVEMINPLQAFKLSNLTDILNCAGSDQLRSVAFLDQLHKTYPFEFTEGNNITQLMNIGAIPISLDAFNVWFKDFVVKKELSSYYFLNFVKDVVGALVTGALKSTCFAPLQFEQRFDAQPIALAKGGQATRGSRSTSDRPSRQIEEELLAPVGPGRLVHIKELAAAHAAVSQTFKAEKTNLGLALVSTDSKPKLALGNYRDDMEKGIYHYYIGAPCGLLKTLNFKREDQPYLREARIQRFGSLGAEQLRELYSVNLKLIGNTLHRNGSYIYINPKLMGANRTQLNLLGLHGYYLVTGVKSTISESGFDVDVTALHEGMEIADEELVGVISTDDEAEDLEIPIDYGALDSEGDTSP